MKIFMQILVAISLVVLHPTPSWPQENEVDQEEEAAKEVGVKLKRNKPAKTRSSKTGSKSKKTPIKKSKKS